MTGAHLRVKRDGKWQPVEVEHLTADERREAFKNRTPDEIMRWMDLLCETVAACEVATS